MCGRYTQTAKLQDLMDRFGIEEPDFDLAPRYNLAPSQDAPVVGVNPKTPDTRSLRLMRWGLVPYHAKDAAKPIINARAETLAQRPAFRGLLPRRRCLVPADGFYEWRREGRFRTPMRFTLQERPALRLRRPLGPLAPARRLAALFVHHRHHEPQQRPRTGP